MYTWSQTNSRWTCLGSLSSNPGNSRREGNPSSPLRAGLPEILWSCWWVFVSPCEVYGRDKLQKRLRVIPWRWAFLRILVLSTQKWSFSKCWQLIRSWAMCWRWILVKISSAGTEELEDAWRNETLSFTNFLELFRPWFMADRGGRQLKHYSSRNLMYMCITHTNRSQVMNLISQNSNKPINTPSDFYTFFHQRWEPLSWKQYFLHSRMSTEM